MLILVHSLLLLSIIIIVLPWGKGPSDRGRRVPMDSKITYLRTVGEVSPLGAARISALILLGISMVESRCDESLSYSQVPSEETFQQINQCYQRYERRQRPYILSGTSAKLCSIQEEA